MTSWELLSAASTLLALATAFTAHCAREGAIVSRITALLAPPDADLLADGHRGSVDLLQSLSDELCALTTDVEGSVSTRGVDMQQLRGYAAVGCCCCCCCAAAAAAAVERGKLQHAHRRPCTAEGVFASHAAALMASVRLAAVDRDWDRCLELAGRISGTVDADGGVAQAQQRPATWAGVDAAKIIVDALAARAGMGWTSYDSRLAIARYGVEIAAITAAAADGLLARGLTRALAAGGVNIVGRGPAPDGLRVPAWRDPVPTDAHALACCLDVVDGAATGEQIDVALELCSSGGGDRALCASSALCRRALLSVGSSGSSRFTTASLIAIGRMVLRLRGCVAYDAGAPASDPLHTAVVVQRRSAGVVVDWSAAVGCATEALTTVSLSLAVPECEAWRQMARVANSLRLLGKTISDGRVTLGPLFCSGTDAGTLRRLDAALSSAGVGHAYVPLFVTAAVKLCSLVCRCRYAILAPGGADWRAIAAVVKQANDSVDASDVAGTSPTDTTVTGLACELSRAARDELAVVALACASHDIFVSLRPLFESGCLQQFVDGDAEVRDACVNMTHVSTVDITAGLERAAASLSDVKQWCERLRAGGVRVTGDASRGISSAAPPGLAAAELLAPAARHVVLGLSLLRDVRSAVVTGAMAPLAGSCRLLSSLIGGDVQADTLLSFVSGLENPAVDAGDLAAGARRTIDVPSVPAPAEAATMLRSAVVSELRAGCVAAAHSALVQWLSRMIDETGPVALPSGAIFCESRASRAPARAVAVVAALCDRSARARVPLTRAIATLALSLRVVSEACGMLVIASSSPGSDLSAGAVDAAAASAKEKYFGTGAPLVAGRQPVPLDERASRRVELCRVWFRQRDAKAALLSALESQGHEHGRLTRAHVCWMLLRRSALLCGALALQPTQELEDALSLCDSLAVVPDELRVLCYGVKMLCALRKGASSYQPKLLIRAFHILVCLFVCLFVCSNRQW